jgi:hypothetical protein
MRRKSHSPTPTYGDWHVDKDPLNSSSGPKGNDTAAHIQGDLSRRGQFVDIGNLKSVGNIRVERILWSSLESICAYV